MEKALNILIVEAVARTILANAAELTDLDQAIGDGDHGINMKRGFEAVLADLPGNAAKPWPELLKAIGMTMVMKVGGASGPLYGTLFLELAKAMPAAPTRKDVIEAFGKAIEGVKARGKSDVGQKTMLDVLAPTHAALLAGASPGEAASAAREAADRTIPMQAIRGRASFLGERSIGHMDPGSRSASLIITAIAEVLEGKR